MKILNNDTSNSIYRFGRFLLLIPIPLFVILAVSLHLLEFDNSVIFDPPGLLPLLNLLFLFICPVFVGYMAAKAYIESGSSVLITMSSGVFLLAFGSLIAGFLLPVKGPNAVITIHNISAGLSGVFHLLGAMLVFVGVIPVQDARKRKSKLVIKFSGIFIFLVILTFGVHENILPTFFIQGQGPTLLRQIILGIATFSFLVSGLLFIILYKNSRSIFLYWYAVALFLISIGLGCVFIQKSFGGPIGWLGRTAQYTGGLYLVISILSGAKEVDMSIMRFDKALEKFFRNRFEVLLMERTTELENEITEHKKTEEVLKRNQALLDSTQNLAHIGGWQWDVEKQTMFWTEEAYRIHDFETEKPMPGAPEHIALSIECYLPEDRPAVLAAFQQCVKKGQPYDLKFQFTTAKGRQLWVRTLAEPVLENGKVIYVRGIIMDITSQKQAEEQIKASLKEKETLLQEIHHRVKNNLTVVSSLLGLQANSMNDKKLKAALTDSQNRVQSMSAIHETLYQSEDLSSIDMNVYLSKLSRAVAQNYTIGNKIHLKIEAEKILIGAKQASPVGLIVNELITNSFKYAFPDNQGGDIKIIIQKIEDQIELEFADNGIGMPEGLDWKNSKSLGLKLVTALVENQLDGSIGMESKNGTKFTIKFDIET